MTMLASQITSLTVVYSIVYSGVNQRKHQSSASLAFVREIHRGPVNFPHKWPVTRKMFPFDDVIMCATYHQHIIDENIHFLMNACSVNEGLYVTCYQHLSLNKLFLKCALILTADIFKYSLAKPGDSWRLKVLTTFHRSQLTIVLKREIMTVPSIRESFSGTGVLETALLTKYDVQFVINLWPWLVLELSTVLALTQLGIRQSDWWVGIRSTNLHIVVELRTHICVTRPRWAIVTRYGVIYQYFQ